jgi:hypothetical protein
MCPMLRSSNQATWMHKSSLYNAILREMYKNFERWSEMPEELRVEQLSLAKQAHNEPSSIVEIQMLEQSLVLRNHPL